MLAAVAVVAPGIAAASLSDVLRSPRFAHLGIAPLATPLAETVAATYPVASASASVEFEYDPKLDVIVRRPGVLGPIVGERAETLGPGRFELGVAYSFVDLATINGSSLDDLVSAPARHGRILFVPVPGGITLRDGRTTTLLPVRVGLDLGMTAHVVAPSVTYGVTSDWDVNVTAPVLRTALDVRTETRVPDPRIPEFALPRGDPAAGTFTDEESDASEGVGDLLLRTKYVVHRGAPVDLAVGLGLALPTGSRADFQGSGTTRVEPLLIASRRVAQRLELLANAGAELNANDVDRSVVRWAVGGTAMLFEPLAAAVTFLGRHELARQTEPIRLPFFFQIERNEMYDVAVGLRWRFAAAGIVSADALLPLNRDGLRSDVTPTVQAEYAF
jgi:outer membrane putative beta-barrel porin/alpha-amylase